MNDSVLLSYITSSVVAGPIVTCCLILSVARVLVDDIRKPVLSRISKYLSLILIPFLAMFALIFVVWVAARM